MTRAVDEAVLEGLTDDERRAVIAAAGRFARAEVVLSNLAIVGVGGFAVAMLSVSAVLPFLRSQWLSEFLFESAPAVLAVVIGSMWLVLVVVAAVVASKSIRRRAVMRAVGSHARRAVCIGCGYSLLGLAGRTQSAGDGPPAAKGDRWTKLACPECGMVCPMVRVSAGAAKGGRA